MTASRPSPGALSPGHARPSRAPAIAATLRRVPARDLRRGDVTLGSKLRVLTVAPLPGVGGKVCLTLERLTGKHAGTTRTAEWHRGTIIGIHRPDDCGNCGGSGVQPGTVGAGCPYCEHGKTPPPFKVTA